MTEVDLALDNLADYIERYGSLGINSVEDILRDDYDMMLSLDDLEYVTDMSVYLEELSDG